MKCLAINTANAVLSVALHIGGDVAYHFSTEETRDQGNLLLNHAAAGLKTAGIGYADLDLMATVTGPGSFTGIRIGLAAMRALAMAANKPLIGLSSFELFATPREGHVNVIAIEAWREELYLQIDNQPPVNETPQAFLPRLAAFASRPVIISGDAAAKLAAVLPQAEIAQPPADARRLAELAIRKFEEEGADAALQRRPVPFYLRDADVTISARQNRHIEGQE